MKGEKKKSIILTIGGAVLLVTGILVFNLFSEKEDVVIFVAVGVMAACVGFYMLIFGISGLIGIIKDKKWMAEINTRNARYGMGQYSADNLQGMNSNYNGNQPVQGQYYNGPPPLESQYYNGNPPVQGQYYNGPPPLESQYYNGNSPMQGQYYNENQPTQGQYYNGAPPMQGQYYNGAVPMQGQYYNGNPPVQGQNGSGVSQGVYPSDENRKNEEIK